ncbi:hypothetical protein [Sorangium sp. So ce1078]|uniref:hypothetical protein n=1 Tax=Sorangium sp. So ce1078 TaxID=3133329 RepID=UPI003F638432
MTRSADRCSMIARASFQLASVRAGGGTGASAGSFTSMRCSAGVAAGAAAVGAEAEAAAGACWPGRPCAG